ncbi:MAG: DUF302 domain-containing protein [Ilumatobacteraceae bacterium]
MEYALSIDLDLPHGEAVVKVKEAFAAQGFGILTEIDVQATLKAKTGADIEPYLILGACNPQLAQQALEIERQIGLLLPCNVVVRAGDGCTIVEALDANVIAEIPDRDELVPVAEEAGRLIRAALDSLTQQP